jgi:hypothetical protein
MKTIFLSLACLLSLPFFTVAQIHNETKPMFSDTLLYENWSSGSFNTNQWTLPPCDTTTYSITNVFGNPSPSVQFKISTNDNCSYALVSKEFSGTNNYTELRYDVYFDDSAYVVLNFAVEVYDGSFWHTVDMFDNNGGSFPWTSRVLNISDYCKNNFVIRLLGAGDEMHSNHINIDNIIIGSFPLGITPHRNSDLTISPNPATNEITIETSTTPVSQLSIVNLNGQELLTRQITETKTQIDISTLTSGVYFVRLTNDKSVEVRKIIKQ